ncbi:MAG: hypothetical protein JNM55_23050 [Anaerolineales bacterium]|nr:hypothetical protein [Anaerolineales bacterium]
MNINIENVTFDQWISIVTQVGAWVTVILILYTLLEMKTQRKLAQKAELIVPNVSILGYSRENGEIFIATYWKNKEAENKDFVVGELPKVTLYNIGAGAAKGITVRWNFEIEKAVKSIKDYCVQNSLPINITSDDGYLFVGLKENITGVDIQADSNFEYPYLLPASVTANGLEVDLPSTILNVISILSFLTTYQSSPPADRGPLPSTQIDFATPYFYLELQYEDIGRNKYKKRFDVTVSAFSPYFADRQSRTSYYDPILYGKFEFKERKWFTNKRLF